ncbi:g1682 [Coccomyxa elongata]
MEASFPAQASGIACGWPPSPSSGQPTSARAPPAGRSTVCGAEVFRERWCHRDILCVLGAKPNAQLVIHWSAQHPVPLHS